MDAGSVMRRIGAAALVCALAFFAWDTVADDGSRAGRTPPALQEAGSAMPCDVPLGWYVGVVDDGFDLTRSDVRAAVRTATDRWEEAARRTLFTHDPEGELPVHLVYGPRQEGLRALLRTRRYFEGQSRRIGAQKSALEVRQRELEREWSEFGERHAELQEKVALHNRRARDLEARQEVTQQEIDELRHSARRLEALQQRLDERQEELRAREKELQEDIDRFNRRTKGFIRRTRAKADSLVPGLVDAGRYTEDVHARDGRMVSVSNRMIRIFQFPDRDVLGRVIAHELGHALGLGHATDSTAVMAARTTLVDVMGESFSVTPADAELLRSACAEAESRS